MGSEQMHQGDKSLDSEAAEVVRSVAEASPPKSIETIKAIGDVTEGALLNERIRRRAYEMWEVDGRPLSDGIEYWKMAEREISQR